MSNLPAEPNGLRKRLEALGQKHDALVQELNNILNTMNRQLSVANEVVNALSKIVGEDEVKAVMEETREAQRKAAEDQQIRSLELLKEKHVLNSVPVIADDSIVVTSETPAAGEARRHQFSMSEVQAQDVKGMFLGKKVGDVFNVGEVKVEVKEIYLYDQARANEVVKEEQEKAANKTPAPAQS